LIQSDQDQFDWERRSGATPSRNTGPSGDHTTNLNGNGKFMCSTKEPSQLVFDIGMR